MKTVTIQMERAVDNFSFPADGKVANLVPDPEVWLLFEGTVSMKKF
jgi:hypothetical protein